MGLFGFNAEKKLKKADEHLAKENHYDARIAYEEILLRDGVPSRIIDQAKIGWRKARKALMEIQTEEAKRLVRGGEPQAARESCVAAIEQAGEDLDASEAKALLDRINEGQTEAARLLEGLDGIPAAEQLPPEQAETEEEAPLEGVEEVFEVLLQPLAEEQAEALRGFAGDFRKGYSLLQEGKAAEALECFSRVPEDVAASPYFQLEKAQALMLARRFEEALAILDHLELPGEHTRRIKEMRIDILAKLERGQEAVDEAYRMWQEDEQNREATLLYTEMLLENKRAQEAEDLIKPLHTPQPDPDVDSLLVRAYVQLEKLDDARQILEPVVEGFFQNPTAYQRRFPLWAARDLLGLYVAVGEEPQRVRAIVQHLISYHPEGADEYKAVLRKYAEQMEGKQPGEQQEPGSIPKGRAEESGNQTN